MFDFKSSTRIPACVGGGYGGGQKSEQGFDRSQQVADPPDDLKSNIQVKYP
jgi:hypothetical protein